MERDLIHKVIWFLLFFNGAKMVATLRGEWLRFKLSGHSFVVCLGVIFKDIRVQVAVEVVAHLGDSTSLSIVNISHILTETHLIFQVWAWISFLCIIWVHLV